MAYKKPQIVAKSAAKQTFVAGCPNNSRSNPSCTLTNKRCFTPPLN